LRGELMNRKGYLTMMASVALLLGASCSITYKPVITSLQADSPWTAPLDNIRVTCDASDPGGSEVIYEWSASGGNIGGTGAIINWIAPEEVGMYDVTVVVSDNLGGEVTASIPLIASNGPPPVIEDLIVTAEHKYLKETDTGYKVAKAYNYIIECVASSNTSGELIYEWSCTNDDIFGEGSSINWTAPDAVCTVTVTAKVFDALGNWVRKSTVLEVVPCSTCAFG
jgi:hypothetical protein